MSSEQRVEEALPLRARKADELAEAGNYGGACNLYALELHEQLAAVRDLTAERDRLREDRYTIMRRCLAADRIDRNHGDGLAGDSALNVVLLSFLEELAARNPTEQTR